MHINDLVSPNDLARVARLQLLARQVVEGFCAGRHRSPHKGVSVEFREHRPYVPGDELRNIDWKVFGKSDRLYVRESEEETNLRCTLVLDRSGSMGYQGSQSDVTKHQYGQCLAASLVYLMLGQQDAVGAATINSEPSTLIPCSSRPTHSNSLLQTLAQELSSGESSIGDALARIAPGLKRRGMLVVLTDAMGDTSSIGRALARFRASKHEVLFFQILDPDELSFPFHDRIRFADLENPTNEHTLDTRSLRRLYLDRLQRHQDELKRVCQKHQVDLVTIPTSRPLVDVLREYLAIRRRLR